MTRRSWEWWIVFSLLMIAFLPTAAVCAQPGPGRSQAFPFVRFYQGLRDRGLYELAERHARKRLTSDRLTVAQRAELACQLAETLSDHARLLPAQQREALLDEASGVLDRFEAEHPESDYALLTSLQWALCQIAQGEAIRLESHLAGAGPDSLALARQAFRQAADRLESLRSTLLERLRYHGRERRGDASSAFSMQEMASLLKQADYRRSQALVGLARCYQADTPSYLDALQRAIEVLQPLAGTQGADAMLQRARIELAQCWRLLGQFERAAAQLDALGEAPASWVQDLRDAEAIRLALVRGETDRATSLAGAEPKSGGAEAVERHLAALEAMLAAWSAAVEAGREDAANQWRERAQQRMAVLSSFGPLPARRAEVRFASRVPRGDGGEDLQTLRHVAENAYHRQLFDEAVAAYDRLRKVAEDAGQGDVAFEAAFQAALVRQKQDRPQEALKRFRDAATQYPSVAKAPVAHRFALAVAGARIGSGEENEAAGRAAFTLALYMNLLREHLSLWPHADGADQVRLQLAQLLELEGSYAEAVETLRPLGPSSPVMLEALEIMYRCEEDRLGLRRDAGQLVAAEAEQAAHWFERIAATESSASDSPDADWTPVRLRALVLGERLRLAFLPETHQMVVQRVQTALDQGAGASPQDAAVLRAMLVEALAVGQRWSEAESVLARLGEVSLDDLLHTIWAISRMGGGPDGGAMRQRLAQLQLGLLDRLDQRADQLDAQQRRTVGLARASALAASGRIDRAIAVYDRLLAEHPQDAEIREALAGLLVQADDAASHRSALALYRDLARKSREPSPRWFRAKLGAASALLKLGEHDHAAEMVQLLRTVHPTLGGPALRAQFDEILQRTRR